MNLRAHLHHYLLLLMISAILGFLPVMQAQDITRDTFKDSVQEMPSFSIHSDNYFITGVPTNKTLSNNTADVKYQVSFKQMISRNALPWNAHLFLTYTQKAFWDFYKDSYPFRELNFNPTLGVGKPLFDKNDRLKGMAMVYYEHESNGRDSIFSRSWNRLSMEYVTHLDEKLKIRAKAWIPFAYQEGNSDILDYRGIGEIQFSYEISPNKLYAEVLLGKGLTWDAKGTFRPRIYYNPFKSNRYNQYFMLEWYVGQGESLIRYKAFTSMVRIGYVIKSNELNFLWGR